SRAGLGWGLKRAYRVGNSDMRVFLKHGHSLGDSAREMAKIAAALLLFPVLFVILALASNRAVDALRRLCRAAGKIAAISGRTYNGHAVTQGACRVGPAARQPALPIRRDGLRLRRALAAGLPRRPALRGPQSRDRSPDRAVSDARRRRRDPPDPLSPD